MRKVGRLALSSVALAATTTTAVLPLGASAAHAVGPDAFQCMYGQLQRCVSAHIDCTPRPEGGRKLCTVVGTAFNWNSVTFAEFRVSLPNGVSYSGSDVCPVASVPCSVGLQFDAVGQGPYLLRVTGGHLSGEVITLHAQVNLGIK